MELASKALINYYKIARLDLCVLLRKGAVPSSLADMSVDPYDLVAMSRDPDNVYLRFIANDNSFARQTTPIGHTHQIQEGDLVNDVFIGKWIVPYYTNNNQPDNRYYQHVDTRTIYGNILQRDIASINNPSIPYALGNTIYFYTNQWMEFIFHEPTVITGFTIAGYYPYMSDRMDMEIMNEEGEWVRPDSTPIGQGNLYVETNYSKYNAWRTLRSFGGFVNSAGKQFTSSIDNPVKVKGMRLRSYRKSGWLSYVNFYADDKPLVPNDSTDFSDITHAIMYPLNALGGSISQELWEAVGPLLVSAGSDPSNDIVISNVNDPINSFIDFPVSCGLRLEGFE